MKRLHLLGFTPDLKGFVLAGRKDAKRGSFLVDIDVGLLKELEAARARTTKSTKSKGGLKAAPLPPPPAPVPKLTPREAQNLLRGGRSVKDVTKRAGMPQEWVERFVGPVFHEVAGVVRMTKDAYQDRLRLGKSGLPIGAAVEKNLIDRRATPETLAAVEDGWDARKVQGVWRVRLRFKHRGSRRTAEWAFKKESRTAAPINETARELGWWPDKVKKPSSRSS